MKDFDDIIIDQIKEEQGKYYDNLDEKRKLYKMAIHEQIEIATHFILRVPNGWIYTDRRTDQAPSGVFVPEEL